MPQRNWTEREIAKTEEADETASADEQVVLLVQGKNRNDQRIWSYVKVVIRNLGPLREALGSGRKFDIREYGEVLAAGLGEPSDEIKQEMAEEYKMVPVSGGE